MARDHAGAAAKLTASASVFAALGDETRLRVVARLSASGPQSIKRLSEGEAVTRQAVTKHLVVLESAGFVKRERIGRGTILGDHLKSGQRRSGQNRPRRGEQDWSPLAPRRTL